MTSLRQQPVAGQLSTLFVALVLAVPAGARAQPTDSMTKAPIVITAGASHSDVERAERLEAQAERDAGRTRNWREVARLRLRAARLRGQSAEAVASYRRAAWLFSASGDHGAGRHAMERAADVALDRGDPAQAIEVFADAALMAREGGDPRQVNRLLQRSRTLLETAVIPEPRRIALWVRINAMASVASR